jgi:hypothetical protein
LYGKRYDEERKAQCYEIFSLDGNTALPYWDKDNGFLSKEHKEQIE